MHPYLDIKAITSPGQCLSWWLVHSFLYYRAGNPIISDKDFDKLTSWLKMSWDNLTHPHKHLVSMEDLNANSGYAIKFPKIVESTAYLVLRETTEKKQPKKVAKQIRKRKTKPDSVAQEYDTLFG